MTNYKNWLLAGAATITLMWAAPALAQDAGAAASPATSTAPTAQAPSLGVQASGAQGAAQDTAAQEEVAAQPVEGEEANRIEEVVVTAERRAQNLQEVPVAVSAFNDENREQIGITNVQDLTNFTPGMAYSTGTDRVTVRGISRFTNNRSSEGGVAIYVDGVYSSSTTAGNLSTLFVDRTEVLRGPQGTLYGRNSVGGAINFISKRPTEDFYAELRGGVRNYNRYDLEAAVSDSLTDHLRFRLATSYSNQREGFFRNLSGLSEGGRGEQIVAEAQLEGDALDRKLEWWLKGQWVKWDNLGRGPGGRSTFVTGDYDTTTLINGVTPSSSFGFTGANPANRDPWLIDVDTPNQIDLDDEQVTLHTTYHFPAFDLRYVGGYHSYDYRLQTDVDETSRSAPYTLPAGTQIGVFPLGGGVTIPITLSGNTLVFPRRENQYLENPFWHSHEINITSTADGPTQWIAGLYYFREGSNYAGIDARMPDQPEAANPVLPIAGLVPAAPNPLRRYAYNATQNVTWSRAIFAQVDQKLNDQFRVTAGLRYTVDQRRTMESGRLLCFLATNCASLVLANGGNPAAVDITEPAYVTPNLTTTEPDPSMVGTPFYDPATGLAHRLLRNEWHALTGTFNVDYQPNDDTLVYAKYTRGYKAGGFNAGSFGVSVTTDPEFINAYEVGVKQQIGGRVQANASLFYYDYRDIQVPLTGVDPITGLNRTNFFNMPKAEITGLELETIWFPTDRLQILANYSYLKAEIKEACCFIDPDNAAAGAQNLAGASLPNSTPHRVSLNANYTWDAFGGSLTASGSYIWRSSTYYSIFNERYNRAPSFGQVDARLLWRDAEEKYTLIGFVRNLTDEQGYLGASQANHPILPTGQQYTLIEPRTFGVELQRRF